MDTLVIKGLKYHALHGVYEEEKRDGNHFEIDLEFLADLSGSATSDDLNDTIDYVRAQDIVGKVMNGPSINLIETLLYKIGEALFDEFSQASQLTVTLRKLNPPVPVPPDYAQVTKTWLR